MCRRRSRLSSWKRRATSGWASIAASVAVLAEVALHFGQQLLRVDRLDDVVGAAALVAGLDALDLAARRHHNHGDVRSRHAATDETAGLEAVHAGNDDVHEAAARHLRAGLFHGLLAVVR